MSLTDSHSFAERFSIGPSSVAQAQHAGLEATCGRRFNQTFPVVSVSRRRVVDLDMRIVGNIQGSAMQNMRSAWMRTPALDAYGLQKHVSGHSDQTVPNLDFTSGREPRDLLPALLGRGARVHFNIFISLLSKLVGLTLGMMYLLIFNG